MKSRIYLDHAATTPVSDAVRAAVVEALGLVGNPSSVHGGGRAANALLEGARDTVARFAGVAPEHVVFTSGGTEAITLASNGARLAGPTRPRLLVGATEHSAVLQARDGVVLLPVDGDGEIDLAALCAARRWLGRGGEACRSSPSGCFGKSCTGS